jgi:adenylate kinase family enzyme
MNDTGHIRLGIVGAAGTGKSSLAEGLSARLGIPNLRSREITEDILRRDGYDYGSGIQIERFLANTGRQNEILRRTIEQQSVSDFVTDRTVIDLASYAVCEMHHSDATALRRIIDTCRKNISVYTHLFLCPWRDTVADTGKRTLNPWYQYLIHLTERGILDEWGCKYHILTEEGRDKRLVEITSFFKDRVPIES